MLFSVHSFLFPTVPSLLILVSLHQYSNPNNTPAHLTPSNRFKNDDASEVSLSLTDWLTGKPKPNPTTTSQYQQWGLQRRHTLHGRGMRRQRGEKSLEGCQGENRMKGVIVWNWNAYPNICTIMIHINIRTCQVHCSCRLLVHSLEAASSYSCLLTETSSITSWSSVKPTDIFWQWDIVHSYLHFQLQCYHCCERISFGFAFFHKIVNVTSTMKENWHLINCTGGDDEEKFDLEMGISTTWISDEIQSHTWMDLRLFTNSKLI